MIRFHIILVLFAILTGSCVEKYFLDKQEVIASRIVVDALITNQTDRQFIKLSRTSSPERPIKIPLSNCFVKVVSSEGIEFVFNESSDNPGSYEGVIDFQYMNVGSKLKLFFITDEGGEYESLYDEFLPCPEVDSIYYEIEQKPTIDPDLTLNGVQFYLDLVSSNEYGQYYLWQLVETWEYHSIWPIKMYYDGVLHNGASDYSLYYCYKTVPVNEVFVLHTETLEQNSFKKFPLHYVDNLTQRLLYKYSILVMQHTVSESTYNFWKNIKKNSFESGGLFDSQPSIVEGNIYNTENTEEIVLGNFGVSTMSQKRIIIEDIQGLSFEDIPVCGAVLLEESLRRISRVDWPVYLVYMEDVFGNRALGVAKSECVDCTLKGGLTEKPDYW